MSQLEKVLYTPGTLGLTGMPLRRVLDPDSVYFGVLPVVPAPRVRGRQGCA